MSNHYSHNFVIIHRLKANTLTADIAINLITSHLTTESPFNAIEFLIL